MALLAMAVHFDPYEIAPYSEGSIEISIDKASTSGY
jgi:hypothetical protein